MAGLGEVFFTGQFYVSALGEIDRDHLAVILWISNSRGGEHQALCDRTQGCLCVTDVDFDILPATIAGAAFIEVPDPNTGDRSGRAKVKHDVSIGTDRRPPHCRRIDSVPDTIQQRCRFHGCIGRSGVENLNSRNGFRVDQAQGDCQMSRGFDRCLLVRRQ